MLLLLAVGLLPFRVFAAGTAASVSIEVEERISGDLPKETPQFQYLLQAETAGAPLPENVILTVRGNEKVRFGEIVFDTPDIYRYTVQEQKPLPEGYEEDSTVYHITVTVIYDETGKLTASVKVQKDASTEKSDAIVFVNTRQVQETEKTTEKETEESEPMTETEAETEKATETEKTVETETSQTPKSGTSAGNSNSTPKTGDTTNLALWMLMLLISGSAAGGMLVFRRKNR